MDRIATLAFVFLSLCAPGVHADDKATWVITPFSPELNSFKDGTHRYVEQMQPVEVAGKPLLMLQTRSEKDYSSGYETTMVYKKAEVEVLKIVGRGKRDTYVVTWFEPSEIEKLKEVLGSTNPSAGNRDWKGRIIYVTKDMAKKMRRGR